MNKNYFTSIIPIKKLETFCFLLFTFSSIIFSSYGQTIKTLTVSDASPLEIPAGVTSLFVQTWGAGGGGGASNSLLSAGGGGGGGAFSQGTVIVGVDKNNVKVPYTVGLGGVGGITTHIDGSTGGSTVFSTISANAGQGGVGGLGINPVLYYGAGGQGGAASVGNYSGGKGANAYLLQVLTLQTSISGGGGGSGGAIPNGTLPSNGTSASEQNGAAALSSGNPAVIYRGAGGDGKSLGLLAAVLSAEKPGNPGGNPGGGGGGAAGVGILNGVVDVVLGVPRASTGGKGGDGQIKVTYTCPVYSIASLTADATCNQTPTITLHSTPVGLPIGTYTVTYNRSSSPATGLTVPMVVETAGIGTISVAGLPTVGLSTITITKLESVDCSSVVNVPIIFNRPIKPIIGATTQPICTLPTGSTVLSGLPAVGTWTVNATPNTIGLTGLTGTGTITTITGLTPETIYHFTVSTGICSSQTVSEIFSVSINPLPTKTWNGTAWSPDPLIVPTMAEKIVFESDYNLNTDIEACSCEVKSGVHVTIKKERYLKLRNELRVITGGSLTFENDASLVQINDVDNNSGNITYKRNTLPVNRYDYTYWSSPVVGQTLKKLSHFTLFDRYFSYHPDLGWEVSLNGIAVMEAGHGYIVRAPQTNAISGNPIPFLASFEGKPNNGIINVLNLKTNKDNLLGNPYPSAMDADKFLNVNSDVLLGTLYFWTHSSPPVAAPGTTTYKYTTSDYVPYNKTGSIASVTIAAEAGVMATAGNSPSGKIAAGQGFFAPTKADGKVVFNNSMRLSSNAIIDNSQFFKLGNTSKSSAEEEGTTTIEKNRVWLNLTNEEGAFKQTLIGYITGATNGYEGSFDGVSYDGNQYVDFYSINQELNLSIQGRALPFQQKDSVALGYKTTIAGDFKINIDHVDGSMASQKVFLEDKTTQVLHDLKEPYTFTTEKGIFNNRFVLRYEDKNAVIEDISDVAVEGVLISSKNKIINIDTTDEIIKTIHVYDFSGRLVYSDTDVNVTATSISNLSNVAQALIVQIVLENGKKAVKKIIY